MPTPFTHLAIVLDCHPNIVHRVQFPGFSWPSFLLGSTAPDVCSIGTPTRRETHFFSIPMLDRQPAYLQLLARYPHLAVVQRMEAELASFIAGYIAHLWLDQFWIARIFEPIYGPDVPRASFRSRLADHNLLRTYVDRRHRTLLPDSIANELERADPAGWLAFVADGELRAWRDILIKQLHPGAPSETIDVFSQRLGIHPRDFAARLESPSDMQQAVFQYLSREQLLAFDRHAIRCTIKLVAAYLSGRLGVEPEFAAAFPRTTIQKRGNA